MINLSDCEKHYYNNDILPPCPNGLSNVGSTGCQHCIHNMRNEHHVVHCGHNLTEEQRRK